MSWSPAKLWEHSVTLTPYFSKLLADASLPAALLEDLPHFYLPLTLWLFQQRVAGRPLVVGINGSQGSGKSTLCQLLSGLLQQEFGCRCCVLALDDLYLTRNERETLAARIHPLLETRGVPGTHDVNLGLQLFKSLQTASAETFTAVPRFDKAKDDRTPRADWDEVACCPDLILFEGWCVGAVPQPPAELSEPLNSLEQIEDSDGVWRRYVNRELDTYQPLFGQLDLLLMLKIPDWEMVYHWRRQQEAQLAEQHVGQGVMGVEALQRFIMHYERLTRYQLMEIPQRADLVVELNRAQRVVNITKKAAVT